MYQFSVLIQGCPNLLPVSLLTLLKLFCLIGNISLCWSRRYNSSRVYKIKICFMRLKLLLIFPDYSHPVLADTNPILSLPHGCQLSMSPAVTQAAPRHRHPLLIPLLHTQATSTPAATPSQVLPLCLPPLSTVGTLLPSWLNLAHT